MVRPSTNRRGPRSLRPTGKRPPEIRRLREELAKVRKALRESQKSRHQLFAASQSVKVLLDRKFRILDVNAALRKGLGYPKGQLLGRVALEFVAVKNKTQAIKVLKRVINGGDAREFVVNLLGRNGTRAVLFAPGVVSVVSQEGQKGYLLSGIDITERQRTEKALRQSEERLRLILEHSTDGINIMELDPKTGKRRLVLCNGRFVEMAGRSREELMAAKDINVFSHRPVTDIGMPHHEYVRAMMKAKSFQGTGSWKRPDGRENYIEWTAAPIRMGDKVYVVGIDRDITERRKTEKALRAANRLLTTAREEERRRLARELHDSVNQGLVGLQLAIQAAMGAVSDCEETDQMDRLVGASGKCGELIREVRHICHGLYPPTLESLGLAASMRQLAGHCRDAGVEASMDLGSGLAHGRLSDDVEIAFFRIAQEAINNSLRHGRASHIQLQLDYARGQALLRIVDDGVGFDATAGKSHGLGINSMMERAKAVGGGISIESRPGRTCIEARVPTTLRPTSQGASQALANDHHVG